MAISEQDRQAEVPASAPAPAHHRTVADALDSLPFTRAQIWVMGLVMAGMLFDTLQQDATGAIGPALKEAFGITNAELVTVNTVTVIGGLIGRLVGGYLADRKGRRFALSLNLLIYTLGGLLSAVAPNYEILLSSRLIVGIGLGGEFTIGLAMISEMVATKRRGTAVGILGFASGGIGNFLAYGLFVVLLGPLNDVLGGDLYSWRWMFAFLAIPAVLVVVYRRYLPESPRFLVSTGRVAEANRALTILASDDIRHRPTPQEVTPFLDADAAAPVDAPIPPSEIFKGKLLSRTVAIGAASWMAFGAQVTLLALLPTLLVSKGYSVSTSLLFTMIMYAGSMFGALAAALRGRAAAAAHHRRAGRGPRLPLGGLLRPFRRRSRADPAVRLDLPVLLAVPELDPRAVVARAVPHPGSRTGHLGRQRHRQRSGRGHAVRRVSSSSTGQGSPASS